jgi:hypothetical protein
MDAPVGVSGSLGPAEKWAPHLETSEGRASVRVAQSAVSMSCPCHFLPLILLLARATESTDDGKQKGPGSAKSIKSPGKGKSASPGRKCGPELHACCPQFLIAFCLLSKSGGPKSAAKKPDTLTADVQVGLRRSPLLRLFRSARVVVNFAGACQYHILTTLRRRQSVRRICKSLACFCFRQADRVL